MSHPLGRLVQSGCKLVILLMSSFTHPNTVSFTSWHVIVGFGEISRTAHISTYQSTQTSSSKTLQPTRSQCLHELDAIIINWGRNFQTKVSSYVFLFSFFNFVMLLKWWSMFFLAKFCQKMTMENKKATTSLKEKKILKRPYGDKIKVTSLA